MKRKQFQLYRHYETDKIIFSDSAAVAKLANSGDIITTKKISELANKYLPIQLNAEEIEFLYEGLNSMRVTVTPEEAVFKHDDINIPMQNIEKCISQLSKDLPKIIVFHEEFGTPLSVTSAAVFYNLLTSVIGTKSYLTVLRRGQKPARTQVARWHGDARFLATILRHAAKRTGRTLSFQTEEGPAVKFIHAALALAGVKTGTYAAIAQAMKRG